MLAVQVIDADIIIAVLFTGVFTPIFIALEMSFFVKVDIKSYKKRKKRIRSSYKYNFIKHVLYGHRIDN